MEWWHAIILGVIEGITEFLPISSTGHLTITEKLLGYQLNDPSMTAFTAIIQTGAVIATVVYFWHDIMRVAGAWLAGMVNIRARKKPDYAYGWAIIIGSIPIAVVGLLFQDEIETILRSLWWVAGALIVWSGVMWWADKTAQQKRTESHATWRDTLAIGCAQCLALIPGVSRSGATMSAGLLRGFDRLTVTRLSFFLSIPALLAASMLQLVTKFHVIETGVGWGPTILGMMVSFLVGYAAVAWLLKFIAGHDYSVFIWYRLGLGVLLVGLLATGAIQSV